MKPSKKQLIALPLLGVGTILAAKSSDAMTKELHDTTMESHAEIKELLQDIASMKDKIAALEKTIDRKNM